MTDDIMLDNNDCYMRMTDNKGRAMYAKRAFHPGEVVYNDIPIASILHPWLYDTHCGGCYKTRQYNNTLKTCSKCKIVRYCSSKCQAIDWKAGHKRECSVISVLLNAGMTPQQLSDCFLAWRVALDNNKYKMAMSMCALSKPSESIALTVAQFISILTKYVISNKIPSFDMMLGLLVRYPCNNFAIVDDLWNGVGAGVYPNPALFNHSCCPNVIPSFMDGIEHRLCFRAISDINEGDEICHSYVELTLPSWKRKDILNRDYEFICHCNRCDDDEQHHVGSEDWCMVQNNNGLRIILTDPDLCGTNDICTFDEVFREEPSLALKRAWERLYSGELINCDTMDELIKLEKVIMEPMEKELNSYHIQLMSASSHFGMTALAIGDFDNAIKYIKRVIDIYNKYLPQYHPLIGLQLFTLADLYNRKGYINKAKSTYKECEKIISVSHGKDSPIYQTLLQTAASAAAVGDVHSY